MAGSIKKTEAQVREVMKVLELAYPEWIEVHGVPPRHRRSFEGGVAKAVWEMQKVLTAEINAPRGSYQRGLQETRATAQLATAGSTLFTAGLGLAVATGGVASPVAVPMMLLGGTLATVGGVVTLIREHSLRSYEVEKGIVRDVPKLLSPAEEAYYKIITHGTVPFVGEGAK